MQTFQKRFGVIGGFLLLLILLAVTTIVTRRQLSVQVENQSWVSHSRQVLFELAQTESLLNEAETGQRGYLYTGNVKYLAPYTSAIARINPHLQSLAELTSDNAEQQSRVSTLRGLVQKKSSELAQTIFLYQSGRHDEAKTLVLSDVGLILMNNVRSQIRAIEQEEQELVPVRTVAYQKSLWITTICIYLSSILAAAGLILLAWFILRQMDLREAHARQLSEREEWFRVTLTSLGDGVIATDEEGRVTFLNPVAEQLTGWTLALAQGKSVAEVFPIYNEYTHQPVDNPVKKVIDLGVVVGLANHTVLRGPGGTLIPIEDSAAPIRDDHDKLVGVVLVFRDSTHERKSQEILRKTEKLAAAARLAATFAHEINNPLEAVVNLIYIVKGMEGLPAAAIPSLDLADQELSRVSHITRQTLGFYRESAVPGRVDLAAVLENVLKLYNNKFKTKAISIERDLSPSPPVLGLAGELTQAVSNLISNAADAVPLQGTIRTKLSSFEDGRGQWVRLVVADDGPGVAPELLDRIFEPFFTTKADVGNGLGLWVTREIVERHDGHIDVISGAVSTGADKELSGAIFAISLPIAQADADA
jgi:PAS domain S-box-containing protein